MSTALAGLNDGLTTRDGEEAFNQLAIQGGFLPRLQLYTSRSGYVERNIVPVNTWAMIVGKDKIEVIGENVHVVPLAQRPMALDLTGKKAVAYYQFDSEGFQKCMAGADVKDSQQMAGIQFLVYVQSKGFATYYAASKSARMLAPAIKKLINNFATLGSQTVDTGKYVFRVPNINLATVEFEVPSMADIKKKRSEFLEVAPVVETEKDLEGLQGDAPATTDSGRVR